jgi:hypothetical protein
MIAVARLRSPDCRDIACRIADRPERVVHELGRRDIRQRPILAAGNDRVDIGRLR